MSKRNQTNRPDGRLPEGSITAAMEETLRLYHAWLGYLLGQQGTDTLRVKVGDIRRALDGFTCDVTREGDEYVIRLGARCGSDCENGTGAHQEACHEAGKEETCDGCSEPCD